MGNPSVLSKGLSISFYIDSICMDPGHWDLYSDPDTNHLPGQGWSLPGIWSCYRLGHVPRFVSSLARLSRLY